MMGPKDQRSWGNHFWKRNQGRQRFGGHLEGTARKNVTHSKGKEQGGKMGQKDRTRASVDCGGREPGLARRRSRRETIASSLFC